MEYTTLWQPLGLIWVSFGIGALLGSMWMFFRMNKESMHDETKAAELANKISFKLLATKAHPDYKWLKEKLEEWIR